MIKFVLLWKDVIRNEGVNHSPVGATWHGSHDVRESDDQHHDHSQYFYQADEYIRPSEADVNQHRQNEVDFHMHRDRQDNSRLLKRSHSTSRSPERISSTARAAERGNIRNSHVRQLHGIGGSNPEFYQKHQSAARMRSAPKSIKALKALMAKKRPWYSQRVVHFIILLIMLLLCVLRYQQW